MQLFGAITTLVAAATTCVSALPRSPAAKRNVGGILICHGANATGTCHYDVYSLTDCHEMPEGFSANARTFAPDNNGFFCWPHIGTCADTCTSPTGCTFGAVDFYNPIKYDLAKIQWDKAIGSFDCHLNQTTATTVTTGSS